MRFSPKWYPVKYPRSIAEFFNFAYLYLWEILFPGLTFHTLRAFGFELEMVAIDLLGRPKSVIYWFFTRMCVWFAQVCSKDGFLHWTDPITTELRKSMIEVVIGLREINESLLQFYYRNLPVVCSFADLFLEEAGLRAYRATGSCPSVEERHLVQECMTDNPRYLTLQRNLEARARLLDIPWAIEFPFEVNPKLRLFLLSRGISQEMLYVAYLIDTIVAYFTNGIHLLAMGPVSDFNSMYNASKLIAGYVYGIAPSGGEFLGTSCAEPRHFVRDVMYPEHRIRKRNQEKIGYFRGPFDLLKLIALNLCRPPLAEPNPDKLVEGFHLINHALKEDGWPFVLPKVHYLDLKPYLGLELRFLGTQGPVEHTLDVSFIVLFAVYGASRLDLKDLIDICPVEEARKNAIKAASLGSESKLYFKGGEKSPVEIWREFLVPMALKGAELFGLEKSELFLLAIQRLGQVVERGWSAASFAERLSLCCRGEPEEKGLLSNLLYEIQDYPYEVWDYVCVHMNRMYIPTSCEANAFERKLYGVLKQLTTSKVQIVKWLIDLYRFPPDCLESLINYLSGFLEIMPIDYDWSSKEGQHYWITALETTSRERWKKSLWIMNDFRDF